MYVLTAAKTTRWITLIKKKSKKDKKEVVILKIRHLKHFRFLTNFFFRSKNSKKHCTEFGGNKRKDWTTTISLFTSRICQFEKHFKKQIQAIKISKSLHKSNK